MSESNGNAWPFAQLNEEDGLDIDKIFGGSGKKNNDDVNPFDTPQAQVQPTPPVPVDPSKETDAVNPSAQKTAVSDAPPAPVGQEESAENPIAAAFAEKTVENTKKGLFEKLPIFYHKGAKETIEDTSMTFEELRIRKSDDFTDLEEGKYVSWSVEYGTIRKEVKDPKGTTIASMKETIERSREFLESLKKAPNKSPDCLVKPKVVMKNKGIASYKGSFSSADEARASDKVICLFPASDGRIYEMHKTEQGEFIAPKHKVTEFQEVRAGFIPVLPLIPMSLLSQIIAFFRSFMKEHQEYEALALIYWDKLEKRFFAYVPKQIVHKEDIEADLHETAYDDETRYLHYADIHSHNSMEAFFSPRDDRDERGTGLYLVLGQLDHFLPEIKARICCGGSFVDIDPADVIEDLETPFPVEWSANVTCGKTRLHPKADWADLLEKLQ